MNGVHDMGGMHNLGSISPKTDQPVFNSAWEARVLALVLASPTRGNIDRGRSYRETIPGPEYLAMSYYEKWFRAISDQLIDGGFATREELAAGHPLADFELATPRLPANAVAASLARRGSYIREAAPARFAVGETVRARNINPEGHTRLPRYARGRTGVIERQNGAHVFPDSHAHGQGENPQPLYTVSFTARELWGEPASPRDTVSLDLWEPYLERA